MSQRKLPRAKLVSVNYNGHGRSYGQIEIEYTAKYFPTREECEQGKMFDRILRGVDLDTQLKQHIKESKQRYQEALADIEYRFRRQYETIR